MSRKDKILKLLMDLVSIKSDTNTAGEIAVELFIYKFFEEIPYFKDKETYGLYPLAHDELQRSVVWALIKGKGDKTIILLNHHDVVDAKDYETLEDLAYTPDLLKEHLGQLNLPDDVRADLKSKDWMFGRGTADMKGGAALQMVLMKEYAQKKDLNGNILFISVPDEESISSGMRSALGLMKDLKETNHLKYHLLINSEPHTRINGHYAVYDSSVGKTMVTVYVAGQKSHIGNIFDGVNPSLILSNIMMRTEVDPQSADRYNQEIAPPPSWSFLRDFKPRYDASIPEAAGGYLSYLTMHTPPDSLIYNLKKVCEEAFEESIKQIKTSYETLYPENKKNSPSYSVHVKTYKELYEDAKKIDLKRAENTLIQLQNDAKEKIKEQLISMPESNFLIIKGLLDFVAYNKPTVVIGLSPPYYPHVSSQSTNSKQAVLKDVIRTLTQIDSNILNRHFFMGISDLSYTSFQDDDGIADYVASNMPLWRDDIYEVPFSQMSLYDFPSIILGPWGKDIHQKTERIYIPDLVKNTPTLIEAVINRFL